MRKLNLFFASIILLFSACQKNDQAVPKAKSLTTKSRSCASDELLRLQMAADPTLKQRMQDIEEFTNKAIAKGENFRNAAGEIVIPIVVHVVYNSDQENISNDQIASQIEVLNEDFNLLNKDISKVPQIFSSSKGNVGIKFQLVQTVRKFTTVTSWNLLANGKVNEDVKFSSKGGSDAIDPEHKLNMWSCNLGDDLLGYAQFPGGNPATDGVVLGYFCFGRTGKLLKPFDKGRTATHEVGHWMNLRHIWGDAYCGSDKVDDTPQATIYNFGCPSFPKYNTCRSKEIEMTMNYMDYTDDACMFMFTNGQTDRMKAVFLSGGPRSLFGQ